MAFTDCATGKTFWVEDATNSLRKRYLEVTAPVHFEGEMSYAVVRGSLKGTGVMKAMMEDRKREREL